MPTEARHTDPDAEAIARAERAGRPFVVLRNGEGAQQLQTLDARRTHTIGRKPETDIPLPWDREVSRVHAELRRLAGEWTVSDDGLSQNGTFVNEVRLVGRRRLTDGDLVRVGRTHLTFRDPSIGGPGLTMLPGELNAAAAFSDQQHDVLRELCRPLNSHPGAPPATDDEIAAALDLPLEAVATEMLALLGAFGVDDLPVDEARMDVASAALGSGVVTFEDPS